MFSFERQVTPSMLLTMGYVGNQGHHLLDVLSTNPSNQALCLSLSQPSEVAPGSPTCGPFGEDAMITSASGQVYQGTRVGLGPDYGENTAQTTIGNSACDALEANLRYVGRGSEFLVGHTYSKSIDQASNLGEQLNPLNFNGTRVISAFDMTQDFVASYKLALPFARLSGRANRLTDGWSIAGTTRSGAGFPMTLYDDSDNSLLGTLGNGVNNYLLDTPDYNGGPLQINTNPRNGRSEFNTSAFNPENLGQIGTASRRFFYGPGISNFDMTLTKVVRITEARSFEIRLEEFSVFNHAQFYGAASVDGEVNDPHFGGFASAAAPGPGSGKVHVLASNLSGNQGGPNRGDDRGGRQQDESSPILVHRIIVGSMLMVLLMDSIAHSRTSSSDDAVLASVAGFRTGMRALQELGEARGSFSHDVTQYTPFQVRLGIERTFRKTSRLF